MVFGHYRVILEEKGDSMEQQYIPVSYISEILYCPRNYYYRILEQVEEINHDMLHGQLQEEKRQQHNCIRTNNKVKYRKLQIDSENYLITAVLDEVEEEYGKLYPVEYKKGVLKESISDQVQLCCQAFLLEENFNTEVDKGYIYYAASSIKKEIIFNHELRELTMLTIEKAKQILFDKTVPPPVNDNRCDKCSLSNICLPHEVSKINSMEGKFRKPLPSYEMGRVLYVDTQGASLKKKHGQILVTKDKEVLNDIPITAVDQITVVGQVQISAALIHELLKRSIIIYYVTSHGKTLGWINPTLGKNSVLRIAQIKTADNANKSLNIAKAIIKGKTKNMRTLLVRYNRSLNNERITKAVDFLKIISKEIENTYDIDKIRGYEGIASKYYYDVFEQLFKNQDTIFKFNGRVRRPPTDPVNAMLSYGYTLLTNDITNELIRVGLDPYIGFYHSNVYGRPALALDLIEEFRSIIVDSVVLTLINKKIISPKDFTNTLGACQIEEKGRKAFLEIYRNRIKEEIKHPIFHYKLSYRRVMELQARLLSKVLTGELADYEAFYVR